MNAPLSSPRLPYAHATPDQLLEALASARHVRGPDRPPPTGAQLLQAFAQLQPALCRDADRIAVAPEELPALADYVAAFFPADAPGSDGAPPKGPKAPGRKPEIKQTVGLHPDVLDRLNRVCHWKRWKKAHAVNRALTQWLAQFPEADQPVPLDDD